MTASTDSGSPETSRTTSAPERASAVRVLATSAGSPSAGRMSGPPGTAASALSAPSAPSAPASPASALPALSALAALGGTGPAIGGRSVPTSVSTASGTSGSMNTSAALVSAVRARVVSRPGSPGPEPTNTMRPGLGFCPRALSWRAIPYSQSLLASLLHADVSPRVRHELARTQLEQLPRDRHAQFTGSVRTADAGRADHVGSVQRRHATAQRQLLEDPAVLIDGLDHLGDRAHRCGTTRLQFGEQGPLRGNRPAGVGVVQLRQQRRQRGIAGATLHRQGPLGRSRQHLHRFQRFGDRIEASDSGQTRPGYHDGVEFSAAYPVQPAI